MEKLLSNKKSYLLSSDKSSIPYHTILIGLAIILPLSIILPLIFTQQNKPAPEAIATINASPDNEVIPLKPLLEKQTTEQQPKNAQPTGNYYTVQSVIDGDTIKINYNGSPTSVRLIGIDTPETVHPSKSVECYGLEASNTLKNLLADKTVLLESDATQGDKDYYGRLLRYVWLDNENINKYMLQYGFAYEYTYNKPYKYQSEFKEAEANAKLMRLGLWGSCNY